MNDNELCINGIKLISYDIESILNQLTYINYRFLETDYRMNNKNVCVFQIYYKVLIRSNKPIVLLLNTRYIPLICRLISTVN